MKVLVVIRQRRLWPFSLISQGKVVLRIEREFLVAPRPGERIFFGVRGLGVWRGDGLPILGKIHGVIHRTDKPGLQIDTSLSKDHIEQLAHEPGVVALKAA